MVVSVCLGAALLFGKSHIHLPWLEVLLVAPVYQWIKCWITVFWTTVILYIRNYRRYMPDEKWSLMICGVHIRILFSYWQYFVSVNFHTNTFLTFGIRKGAKCKPNWQSKPKNILFWKKDFCLSRKAYKFYHKNLTTLFFWNWRNTEIIEKNSKSELDATKCT